MHIRKEVFILYGFVRKADNFVDQIPQDKQGFLGFKNDYLKARNGKMSGDVVVDSFVELSHRNNFKDEWVDAFLHSMEMDLLKNQYDTLEETLEYIYGSAEVIGLFMSRILRLKEEALAHACSLGKAMQYINFIRDIAEDIELGRTYFPTSDMEEFGLESLNYEYTKNHAEEFTEFIHLQLQRYCEWQEYAEEGYHYIPRRYLISVKTAAEMYNWTAEQISKQPYVVYDWKVKPMATKIVVTVLSNLIDTMGNKFSKSFCYGPKA